MRVPTFFGDRRRRRVSPGGVATAPRSSLRENREPPASLPRPEVSDRCHRPDPGKRQHGPGRLDLCGASLGNENGPSASLGGMLHAFDSWPVVAPPTIRNWRRVRRCSKKTRYFSVRNGSAYVPCSHPRARRSVSPFGLGGELRVKCCTWAVVRRTRTGEVTQL